MKKVILKLLTAGIKNNASQSTEELTLEHAIAQIDHVFGRDRMLQEFDADFTVPYYTQSELGYRLYHSAEDAVHMALNFDGVFDADGYQAQPRMVAEQVDKLGGKKVLEVGCGKGFNSRFLAQQYPSSQFVGIDLTPHHVALASRKVRNLTNLTFQIGDFNGLNFPSESFDLVFACECLCHSDQLPVTLAELFRLLRPGGKLVIFDGYRQTKLENFSPEIQTITQLTEVSMAIRQGFFEVEDFTEVAKNVGFALETKEDLTFAIQPTLSHLGGLSQLFFRSHWRSKLFTWLLPRYLVRNAVAGLLMPFTFNTNQGSLGYYKLIFKREEEGRI
ncbi:MAG: class I SAM-dependent methyltransferase [Symploca sp. SIO2C1]|nr:class I SAM-dependent methyltransferase [Symploca sp. SIO2C1]